MLQVAHKQFTVEEFDRMAIAGVLDEDARVELQLLAYLGASASGYSSERVLRRGDTIAPSAFPDLSIAVTDVL